MPQQAWWRKGLWDRIDNGCGRDAQEKMPGGREIVYQEKGLLSVGTLAGGSTER